MQSSSLGSPEDVDLGHPTETASLPEETPSGAGTNTVKIPDDTRVFLISDTHFDHVNIIRYTQRPFHSIMAMNSRLVYNWNNAVSSHDLVYFLGDMTFGRRRRPIDYWLGKLNGRIFFIRGNHDTDPITRATVVSPTYLEYNEHQFFLTHDPNRPRGYNGWMIHGDKHNNHLRDYPLINQENKTINISAELVNYTPITLDRLISLIETGCNHETLQTVRT